MKEFQGGFIRTNSTLFVLANFLEMVSICSGDILSHDSISHTHFSK